jgi:mycothiol synthase
VTLRAPSLEDLPALVSFFSALYEVGRPGASAAEVREWLSSTRLDPEANFRVLVEDERILGWCDVWDQNQAHERIFLDVRSHPDEQGAYPRLFDWALSRAEEVAHDGAVIRAWGDSKDDAFVREVEGRGFTLIRHFFTMDMDLADRPPEPEWPEGIAVREFRAGEERAVYEANNEAFADHWDFVPLSFEDWSEFTALGSPEFDPGLWFLAMDGGEIAGFCLCRSERRPGIGHVHILGVRPRWRRRGLGRALLLHAFHELRARGRAGADLGVDAENTTGAVRLYEHAGMHVVRRMDTFEKALP